MKKTSGILRCEQGDIALFVALLMTALVTVCALVTDIGLAYVRLANAQNAADAAVLAAGTLLPVNSDDTQRVKELYDTVKDYAAQNEYLILSDADISLKETDGMICRIDIDTRISIPTYFAKVVGFSQLNSPISSAVGAVPAGSMEGVVPIGLDQAEFRKALDKGETEHLKLKYGGGDGVNGSFGFIFLDGSRTGGAPDFKRWMTYGYNGTLYVGQELYERTGNVNSAVKMGCDYRFSHCHHWSDGKVCTKERYVPGCPLVLMLLVYERTGNADITVTGFAPFIIEGYTNDGAIIGSYVGALVPSDGTSGSSFFGATSISLIK